MIKEFTADKILRDPYVPSDRPRRRWSTARRCPPYQAHRKARRLGLLKGQRQKLLGEFAADEAAVCWLTGLVRRDLLRQDLPVARVHALRLAGCAIFGRCFAPGPRPAIGALRRDC